MKRSVKLAIQECNQTIYHIISKLNDNYNGCNQCRVSPCKELKILHDQLLDIVNLLGEEYFI